MQTTGIYKREFRFLKAEKGKGQGNEVAQLERSKAQCVSFLSLIQDKLRSYILACQDEETGGFADRPGDMVRLRK